jgi:hypothetical protein
MQTLTERILLELKGALTSPDPVDALRALTALRDELDVLEHEQVRRALDGGDTFADVARGLGISRQAAHRRYRYLPVSGRAGTPGRPVRRLDR